MTSKSAPLKAYHLNRSNRLKAAHLKTKADWYRARQLKKLKKARTGFL